MLEQEFGADWTPQVEAAWRKTYNIVVEITTKDLYET
jgi:hypothetical protein